jgi:hypothetical protein
LDRRLLGASFPSGRLSGRSIGPSTRTFPVTRPGTRIRASRSPALGGLLWCHRTRRPPGKTGWPSPTRRMAPANSTESAPGAEPPPRELLLRSKLSTRTSPSASVTCTAKRLSWGRRPRCSERTALAFGEPYGLRTGRRFEPARIGLVVLVAQGCMRRSAAANTICSVS